MPHDAANYPADPDPSSELPKDIQGEPFKGPQPYDAPTRRDGKRKVHKRKRQPIIQARFCGKAEANLVLFAGVRRANLNVRGEHGVCGRQRSAK